MPFLRTIRGSVAIKEPRPPECLAADGVGEKIVIYKVKGEKVVKKNWLRGKGLLRREYRQRVLQAMLMAAARMEVQDFATRNVAAKVPAGQNQRVRLERSRDEEEAKRRFKAISAGTAPVVLESVDPMGEEPLKDGQLMKKERLPMKKAAKTMGKLKPWVERFWSVSNGKLYTYRLGHGHARPTKVYELDKSECVYIKDGERVDIPHVRGSDADQSEATGITFPLVYPVEFEHCLVVRPAERQAGLLFLKVKDKDHACRVGRALTVWRRISGLDRQLLETMVRKAMAGPLQQGWKALWRYEHEMHRIKDAMRSFSRRLVFRQLGKAWHKMRLVHAVRSAEDKRHWQQIQIAIKFMKEKMKQLGTGPARSVEVVRADVVSRVQSLFRKRRSRMTSSTHGLKLHTWPLQAKLGVVMPLCFAAQSVEEIVRMVLDQSKLSRVDHRWLQARLEKATAKYSAVTTVIPQARVSVSEGMTRLHFRESGEDGAPLPEWTHFLNLDQISSVVIHAEPATGELTAQRAIGSTTPANAGVWFTINGPRVRWRGHWPEGQNRAELRGAVGELDGQALPCILTSGAGLRWLRCKVRIENASIPKIAIASPSPKGVNAAEADAAQPGPGSESSPVPLVVHLHLLGRTYMGERFQSTDGAVQGGEFEACVPLCGVGSEAMLDNSGVAVELLIWDVNPAKRRILWTGNLPFRACFAAAAAPHKPETAPSLAATLIEGRTESTVRLTLRPALPQIAMAASSLKAPAEAATQLLLSNGLSLSPDLVHTLAKLEDAQLGMKVEAIISDEGPPAQLSPELAGCGDLTGLYSSCRAAWYDPALRGKFFGDAASSFVEIRLGKVIFPDITAEGDINDLKRYRVELSCNGVVSSSTFLHRFPKPWRDMVAKFPTEKEPDLLDFQAESVFVPLPPGIWCRDVKEDWCSAKVELVVRCAKVDRRRPMAWSDLESGGVGGDDDSEETTAYHIELGLDGMTIDEEQKEVEIYAAPADTPMPRMMVAAQRQFKAATAEHALVSATVVLRDRDYVRLRGLKPALFVGEAARLTIEERLVQPRSEQEWRQMALPGEFKTTHLPPVSWAAPLRDPALPHEFVESGLKGRFQPKRLQDRGLPLVPFKYILPRTEQESLRTGKPGVYWRILETKARRRLPTQALPKSAEPADTLLVSELTHRLTKIACVVLAVYAGRTCDIELAASFLKEWRSSNRKFALPGKPQVVRSASASGEETMRVILQGVPVSSVTGAHCASFNLYDAAAGSVRDIIEQATRAQRGTMDLRHKDRSLHSSKHFSGSYSLVPGPLPHDMTAACDYDWSLRLQARDYHELGHFITMLRQSVKGEHFQKAMLLDHDHLGLGRKGQVTYTYKAGERPSGSLEVVLVEARHLSPGVFQRRKDLVDVLKSAVSKPPSAVATFVAVVGGKEQLYHGSLQQLSPVAPPNANPQWTDLEMCRATGGWAFHTPVLDGAKLQKADGSHLRIEVFDQKGGTSMVSLGHVQVPLHEPQRRNEPAELPKKEQSQADMTGVNDIDLCNPHAPFTDLWLPLLKDETGTLSHGLVHIMTLWSPVNSTELQARQTLARPQSAQECFAMELKTKARQTTSIPVFRDLIYDIPLPAFTYNPNIADKDGWVISRHEAMFRAAEAFHKELGHIDCIHKRQEQLWRDFLFGSTAGTDAEVALKVGELQRRVLSTSAPSASDRATHEKLTELVRQSIPAARRIHGSGGPGQQLWMELTNADEVMQSFSDNPAEVYLKLLLSGSATTSLQKRLLEEDALGFAGLEHAPRSQKAEAHMYRLRRARNICIALIEFSKDGSAVNFKQDTARSSTQGKPACALLYSRSLLYLAYFLLLAHEDVQHKLSGPSARGRSGTSSHTLSSTVPVLSHAVSRKSNARSHEPLQRLLQPETRSSEDADTQEESLVFWLLYTLAGSPSNQAYGEYYSQQRGAEEADAARSSAGCHQDVLRLSCALLAYEPELWWHFRAVGFHISTVFVGAFMRMFAGLLPTSTLFCVWDVLFAESVKPARGWKGPRHGLIDMAFGMLSDGKEQILACSSALEVRDCIHILLQSMHDPWHAIGLLSQAESLLWDNIAHDAGHTQAGQWLGIAPRHVQEFNVAWEGHTMYMAKFHRQNALVREVIQELQLSPANASASEDRDIRDAEMELAKPCSAFALSRVMLKLRKRLGPASAWCGCLHEAPEKMIQQGVQQDWHLGKLSNWLRMGHEVVKERFIGRQILFSAPLHTSGEPEPISEAAWETACAEFGEFMVKPRMGQASSLATSIFMAFKGQMVGLEQQQERSEMPEEQATSGEEHHPQRQAGEPTMSFNELMVALITACRGTVVEKAILLFQLFAAKVSPPLERHITKVSHQAKVLQESLEEKFQSAELLSNEPPHSNEEIRTEVALHLKVWTRFQGAEILLGEVFLPTLAPFISEQLDDSAVKINLPIWRRSSQSMLKEAGAGSASNTIVGHIAMALRWIPYNPEVLEVGQLQMQVFSVRFDPEHVTDIEEKNPSVTVSTYDTNGRTTSVPRMATGAVKHSASRIERSSSVLSRDSAAGGGGGSIIGFSETMVRHHGQLQHPMGAGSLRKHVCGWLAEEGLWCWSESGGGRQASTPDFKMRSDMFKMKTRSGISLQACRLLTQCLMHRCLHSATPLQAALISDSTFNRCGAVSGLLEAMLVQKRAIQAKHQSAKDVKEDAEMAGKWRSVRSQLVAEWEKQCFQSGGSLNLWSRSQGLQDTRLESLGITDPFPSMEKVLWIRYARAGDGERGNALIDVSGAGVMREVPEVPLDIDASDSSTELHVNSHLSLPEFLSCFLMSPLLCESLQSHSPVLGDDRQDVEEPLHVEVSIDGKGHEIADMVGALVQQSICIELWDEEYGVHSEFLGEAWLPELSFLPAEPQTKLLQLEGPRPNSRKDGKRKKAPGDYRGHVYVMAGWTFPVQANELAAEASSPRSAGHGDTPGSALHQRAEEAAARHTGRLTLKIMGAEGLQPRHVLIPKRGKPSRSVHAEVHIRNDCFPSAEEGWLNRTTMTNRVEPVFKTKTVSGSLEPTWKEEKQILIPLAAFEKRTHEKKHLASNPFRSQREVDRLEAYRDLNKVGNLERVTLQFAARPDLSQPGGNHGVKVFASDSIQDFKWKLQIACEREAEADPQLRGLQITSGHVVMAYMPSQQVRAEGLLAQASSLVPGGRLGALTSTFSTRSTKKNYDQMSQISFADPASWQPLDLYSTFKQHSEAHTFRLNSVVHLRVALGSQEQRQTNPRFKAFELEEEKTWDSVDHVDTPERCFAFAKYRHIQDGNSAEWRAAIVERQQEEKDAGDARSGDGSRVSAEWVYHMLTAHAKADIQKLQELHDVNLLLAPGQPRIHGKGNPAEQRARGVSQV